MTTLARPRTQESAHWYDPKTGLPCHTVKCSTKDGERPTNITDAKKLGLVPSVTNVLSVLRKPALETWKQEQCCLSVLTAPRKPDEGLDDFVARVLHEERQHEQEAKDAADLGTRIHKALEDELSGRVADHEMLPWIEPVWEYLNKQGYLRTQCERILVGDGYAGRTDLIAEGHKYDVMLDFKSTKKPPKEPYWEHRLQLSAYHMAKIRNEPTSSRITVCGNIYISTTKPGDFVVHVHEDTHTCWLAFKHLLDYWQVANDYYP